MYLALYRKYRPNGFDEVIGQEHITSILSREVAEGKFVHSYLFTGPRGTGKTSCAKILAKAVNCLNRNGGNPCGECENCVEVEKGSFLDITEMDAASNSKVEDVRMLIEQAVYMPVKGKYRVYIIDEVHMLSNNAFNALLKIIEEPPEHLIFILATTEIHKVLPTIISRCQRFDFGRISVENVTNRLLEISEIENIDITEDGAKAIALISEGGMRDALSLLDVCSANRKEITEQLVNEAVGILSYDTYIELADMVKQGDVSGLLNRLDKILTGSSEPSKIGDGFLVHYRNLLLCKSIDDPTELISCLPSYLGRLKEQASGVSLAEIMGYISILSDFKAAMTKSVTKRLELEITMIKMAEADFKIDSNTELALRVEALERKISSVLLQVAEGTVPKQQAASPAKKVEAPKQIVKKEEPAINPADIKPFGEWSKVIAVISKINPATGGMMSNTKAFFDGKRVLIDVNEHPTFLTMLRENELTRNTIKRAILEVTGMPYNIGPYKAQAKAENVEDPLSEFVKQLPEADNITIKD